MHLDNARQLLASGDFRTAETQCSEFLQIEPSSAESHCLLGMIKFHLGDLHQAIKHFRIAIALKPNAGEIYLSLAGCLGFAQQHYEALKYLREAEKYLQNRKELYQNLGAAYEALGEFPLAEEAYLRALELDPNYVNAHSSLGRVLRRLGRYPEAMRCHRTAIEINPDYHEGINDLAIALSEVGHANKAIQLIQRIIDFPQPTPQQHSALLVTTHSATECTPAVHFAAARSWATRYADPFISASSPHQNDRNLHRRLRVGFVSADFRNHPIGRLVEPIFAYRDPMKTQMICYSSVAKEDDHTSYLRGLADDWRQVVGMSDGSLANRIRDDRIDLLVDLSGHFAMNRLGTFARKPAPIQLSHLGYCDTTGMRAMDYRLTDAFSDPPGQTERYHTERLVRLPHTVLCHKSRLIAPEVGPLPALQNGYVTFGNLNNLIKASDESIASWSAILKAVPGSRFTLAAPTGAESYVIQRFAVYDIGPDRLQIISYQKRDSYLQSLTRIDIALDPFPFNGDNTTFETLWMGVPIVSLIGKTFTSRRGFCYLSNIGLANLAASTTEGYVQIAASLARNLPKLAALRSGMRKLIEASPLLNADTYVKNLETIYRRMWHDWCRKPI